LCPNTLTPVQRRGDKAQVKQDGLGPGERAFVNFM
jgi:hypothetical protein